MTKRTIDYRRSHVYAGEDQALEGTVVATTVPYETLVADVQKVLSSAWWAELGGGVCSIVQSRSSISWWRPAARELSYAVVAPRYVGAHELAHAIHTFVDRTADHRAHGPEWRGWYVTMVHAMYGPEEAQLLSEGFQRHLLAVAPSGAPVPPVPLCAFDLPAPTIGGWRKPC